MREQVRLCRRCFNVTDSDECSLCRDLRRDPTVLCVVERAQDIVVVERSREFRGRYHVLGGAISPIEGIGPERLRFRELVERVRQRGDRRGHHRHQPLCGGGHHRPLPGQGAEARRRQGDPAGQRLPVGGDLDYADELTLGRALTGRREM